MAGTINIPIGETYDKIKSWLSNFFQTIDAYEGIAVGAIAVGTCLIIVGLIML